MDLSLGQARDQLRELELFRECKDSDLDRVAALARSELRFEPGALLYREGDPAQDCYVILEGEADVTVSGRFVGTVGEGESVGEMGLLDGAPRTATVVARTPVLVQVIDARSFDRLLDEAPMVTRALLRQVSRWLRERGETVAKLAALAPEPSAAAPTTPAAPKATSSRVVFDPAAPGFYQNPYAQYAELRAQDPVHYSPEDQTWFVSRYEDVLGIGRNKELSVEISLAKPSAYVDQELARLERQKGQQTRMMFRRDPPNHTRMRRQVYKAFTPKAVKEMRPRLQAIVDQALDRMAAKGSTELISDFAYPLPLVVISEMLGMPQGNDERIRAWSQAITKALDPSVTEAELEASIAASDAMTQHLRGVIAEKSKRPADDLLSHLISIQQQSTELSEEELVDQLMLLYIAGHETTVNLIGNGMLALLKHRDQLDRLRLDPALEANAIEELLRYDSPAQFTRRIARKDIEIGGRKIEQGSVVFAILGAGNRDPEKWGAGADHLDIARQGAHEHVSFGGGVHHCLGASLVRLEGQVALGTLLRRFPRMELAAEPEFSDRMALRGLRELRLELGT